MRVLITGGRDFLDQLLLFKTLDELHSKSPISLVIHGTAKGADSLAHHWAEERRVSVEACPPDWKRFGRAAGVIRNKAMLEKSPDLLVAFSGSRGTADMVRRARKAGLRVIKALTSP